MKRRYMMQRQVSVLSLVGALLCLVEGHALAAAEGPYDRDVSVDRVLREANTVITPPTRGESTVVSRSGNGGLGYPTLDPFVDVGAKVTPQPPVVVTLPDIPGGCGPGGCKPGQPGQTPDAIDKSDDVSDTDTSGHQQDQVTPPDGSPGGPCRRPASSC